ncbi:hypothetical protein ScPMuIL_015917 [Solemya velum]
MMKKGTVPMRVRRRQSDAKWRASVAKCYDTLKYVIPDCRKQSRRKVSKALILQETEKHIINLEKKLKEVLDIRARNQGKIAIHTNGEGVYPASLDSVKKEYVQIQQTLFMQGGAGRKRYNVPVDVEVSLENLQKEISAISVMPLPEYNNLDKDKIVQPKDIELPNLAQESLEESQNTIAAKTKSVRSIRKIPRKQQGTKCKVLHLPVNSEGKQTKSILCPIVNRNRQFTAASYFRLDDQTVPVSTIKTATMSSQEFEMSQKSNTDLQSPVKREILSDDEVPCMLANDLDDLCTPQKTPYFQGANMPRTPVSSTTGNFPTPSKVAKKLPFSTRKGFTPVKLPAGSLFSRDTSPSQCLSTVHSFQSPEIDFLSPGTPASDRTDRNGQTSEDAKSLLCTESIENMDLEDGWEIEKTPHEKPIENLTEEWIAHPHKSCCETPTKKQRKHMKCRKRLENFYPQKEEEMQPIITGVFDKDASALDFDRYLLFYGHVAEQLKFQETADTDVAHRVSRMWQNMSEEDRETLITIASLDRTTSPMSDHSSNLSEDLIDLDVKPLVDKDLQLDFSSHSAHYQVVPEFEKTELKTSDSVQIVPSSTDLLWCSDFTSHKSGQLNEDYVETIHHNSPVFEDPGFFGDSDKDSGDEQRWQSQIVPELPKDQQTPDLSVGVHSE